jgi:hypothetical protein
VPRPDANSTCGILFVGFSDDRGLIFICFGFAALILLLLVVIVAIWISWRHRVEDGEIVQTGGNALISEVRAAMPVLPLNVATFALHRNVVGAA